MRKQKVVKKGLGVAVICSLIITTGGIFFSNNAQAEEINKNNINNEYIKRTNHIDKLIKQHEYDQKQIQEEVEKVKRKPEYQIPLPVDYQNLIWELCNKNYLSYELALSVIYKESQFNVGAINYNKDKSVDQGLFQLNSYHIEDYIEWAKQYCDLKTENINVLNPKDNIRLGIAGLVHYRNLYQEKGVGEENLIYYVLGSFNYGETGYQNYINQHRYLETTYANEVIRNKYNLEQNGVLE